jgi:hypothetical protein
MNVSGNNKKPGTALLRRLVRFGAYCRFDTHRRYHVFDGFASVEPSRLERP